MHSSCADLLASGEPWSRGQGLKCPADCALASAYGDLAPELLEASSGGGQQAPRHPFRQLSECWQPREHQPRLQVVWVPARNISTSKGKKKNPYWGLMCKAFGVTELGPFAVKGEGLKHPVGLYLGLTVFHSASAVPRLLRSQGS